MRVRRVRISRSDPDVMASNSLDQLALRCDGPLFDVRRQPVRIRENKICNIRFAEVRCPLSGADKRCDHNGESRR